MHNQAIAEFIQNNKKNESARVTAATKVSGRVSATKLRIL
ncbi:hypothetical protein SDC9_92647 [bioreactor metagenome]|uniref:Uncharacterized protein n=1 Tax=bioreactor metagenome TaxID=1076179 RepID=A0A645A540_9ZZZZ